MPRRSGTSWDFTGFSLLGAMLNPTGTDPAGLVSGDAGRVWVNTGGTPTLKFWDGSAAIDLRARASHTGTQVASTISDLATVVKAYRLDEFAAPNTALSMGSQRITNVTDPSGAQDAATRNYVDTALSGLASGQVLKGAVRAAATTNINIVAAPATVDGVTPTNGDIFLLTGQTTAADNGPRVWTAAGAAMNRAANWDTSGEATLGSYWIVREGTNADTFAMLTNDSTITLNTTALTFVFRGAAGASYTAGGGIGLSGTDFSVAAGTALTQDADGLSLNTAIAARAIPKGVAIPAATAGIFTVSGSNVVINHGLNNLAPAVVVTVGVTPASGYTAKKPVEMDWEATDANNVTVTFPAAPATGNWVASVIG